MIILQGNWITKLKELSATFRDLVGLVPDGTAWLQWAMAEQEVVLSAPDESELLTQLVLGLHGCELITMSGLDLAAHPQRLMRLDEKLVKRMLRASQSGDPIRIKAVWKALSEEGVAHYPKLAAAHKLLAELGVSHQPLFAAMDLESLVALNALSAPSQGVHHRAAEWAVGRVQSCAEFVDAYRFCCTLLMACRAKKERGCMAMVQREWELLAPLANNLLETLCVGRVDSDEDLVAQIGRGIYNGEPLGFATRFRALRILGAKNGYATGDDDWSEAARETLMDARCTIRRGNLKGVTMSQGGRFLRVHYISSKSSLTLECGPGGLVTVAEFDG